MTKTLLAEFVVRPGHQDRVHEMMTELTELVRREPGNLAFQPYVRQDNPRAYVVYEVYRDQQAFEDHIAAEYGRRFNAELGLHIEGEASELTWLVGPVVP